MSLFTKAVRGRGAVSALARNYASVSDAAGVRVAGIENGAPAGTQNLTVVVKAGSRYETKPGVAHVLKNFAFKVRRGGASWESTWETATDVVKKTVDAIGIRLEDSQRSGAIWRSPYGRSVERAPLLDRRVPAGRRVGSQDVTGLVSFWLKQY